MTINQAGIRAAAALLLIAAIAGCGSVDKNAEQPFGGAKNNMASGQAEAFAGASEQVQSVYKQSCLSCHGNSLEGRVGPKTNLQKAGGHLTKEQITKQITGGGNGMPGFGGKLKPEEIDALASWLAEKK
ncbi:c-type cytochrome [Paenibacillus radicis (ex Xue et al. 2023)]|uniref:C-type cytochrome n=1 Tax=Paenibacillus radicis (ex Xue et al. 2023) TaxID=2972489 RepID=A0ABT1YT51_9BACL|nr:c-type cytochrome [Paenibacillus radicis (ex Xue et al. 2023)]MCR8636364.1 c-type cytochrome [Paenibacillus radicis (ex Xue et al. 2023)]